MKKIFTLLFAVVGLITLHAQTVYSENMGTPTTNTLITAYTGWQNSSPIVYSGTGDVRTSTASTGYSGSSGSGNVFLTSTAGRNLIISGINTSAYSSTGLTLSFGYLTNATAAQLVLEQSTDGGTTWTPISFANNTNTSWNLVSITGVLASSSNLSLKFTQPATAQMRIDDVKIVNVSTTCALVPSAATTQCDSSTLSIDTYTITIPFTGGGTATYSVNATAGTVGGDNPSTVAAGNIIITGTQEGVNNTVTISGGTCSYTIEVNAPAAGCKPINPLPVAEHFNYTAGEALQAQQMWTGLFSGDNIVVAAGNLTYPGTTPSGNSITFDGAGLDALLPFTETTSGAIYSSFTFSVNDLSNITTDLASTYFLILSEQSGTTTNARLHIRKNGTQYQFGLGSGATADTWSPNLYNPGTVQYLTFGYDFASNQIVLFENQTTPLTPSIMVTATAPITKIGGLVLRQDSSTLTPFIQMDELAISNNVIVLGVSDLSAIKSNFVRNTLVRDEISFGSKSSVKIYNMNGQIVKSAAVEKGSTLSVSSLPKGIYIVTGNIEGQVVSQKITKN